MRIVGRKTSKTSFLKDCPGCGCKFWGRRNAAYHNEACRKKHRYPDIKDRLKELTPVFHILVRNFNALKQFLQEGQEEVKIPIEKALREGVDFRVFTGIFQDPQTRQTYFCCGTNLQFRYDQKILVIRHFKDSSF